PARQGLKQTVPFIGKRSLGEVIPGASAQTMSRHSEGASPKSLPAVCNDLPNSKQSYNHPQLILVCDEDVMEESNCITEYK
ncbi:MAG: hypothetical protein KAI29_26055, partial [Cyclobacteriaceae bacterium]|nr:hypothetical protein [Cyclobacteriaceae bacterium]